MNRITSTSVEEFRTALRAAKNIIVVAGAGLSAASGIATFRGSGGMWRSLNAMELATPEAFGENPSLVWQFYHYRREKALKARPNAAHVLLAKLSIPNVLRQVAPLAESYHLITQNVDGLSPRAMDAVEKSIDKDKSEKDDKVDRSTLIEMHGRLFELSCTECDHVEPSFESPLTPALAEADKAHANEVEAGSQEIKIPLDKLPRCVACGALARPNVVWFGETIPLLPKIEELVDKADFCLVVGTSSTVWPAAGFAETVREREDGRGRVAVFNVEESSDGDFLFLGPSDVELPKAVGIPVDMDEIEKDGRAEHS